MSSLMPSPCPLCGKYIDNAIGGSALLVNLKAFRKKEHAFVCPLNLDQVNKALAVDEISSMIGTEVMTELRCRVEEN